MKHKCSSTRALFLNRICSAAAAANTGQTTGQNGRGGVPHSTVANKCLKRLPHPPPPKFALFVARSAAPHPFVHISASVTEAHAVVLPVLRLPLYRVVRRNDGVLKLCLVGVPLIHRRERWGAALQPVQSLGRLVSLCNDVDTESTHGGQRRQSARLHAPASSSLVTRWFYHPSTCAANASTLT